MRCSRILIFGFWRGMMRYEISPFPMNNHLLDFKILNRSNLLCILDLEHLYPRGEDLINFDARWEKFFVSDSSNQEVFSRNGNIIIYPHKSWVPEKEDGRPSILFLFGNPAPHSVYKDVYFAYEGKGQEHRLWKVFRELGVIDLHGDDSEIKRKFLGLDYCSPFRLGFEVLYTFPSSASELNWSGVTGLEKLFGGRAIKLLLEVERQRLMSIIEKFLRKGGTIVAMQKDSYNALSRGTYKLQLAVQGQLISKYRENIKIIGTPPTRWLYTQKMKSLLQNLLKEPPC